jgi:hypothetical protein
MFSSEAARRCACRGNRGSRMYQITQYFQSFTGNTLRLMHSMDRMQWLIALGLAFAIGAYWLAGMSGRKQ